MKGAEAVPQTTGPHMWTHFTHVYSKTSNQRGKGVWVEFRVPRRPQNALYSLLLALTPSSFGVSEARRRVGIQSAGRPWGVGKLPGGQDSRGVWKDSEGTEYEGQACLGDYAAPAGS